MIYSIKELKTLLEGTPVWAIVQTVDYIESKKAIFVSYNSRYDIVTVRDAKKSIVTSSHGVAPINRTFKVSRYDIEKRAVRYVNSDECHISIDETPEDFCY